MNSDTNNQIPRNENAGQGYLVIHVTTARGAIPLEGAQVSIRNYNPEGSLQRGDVIATLVSGRDGNTAILPLAAPPRTESMKPGGPLPYASYIAEVHLEGYSDQSYSGIPIFDGITAIQPADLIPIPENGTPDGYSPNGSQGFESTAPDL